MNDDDYTTEEPVVIRGGFDHVSATQGFGKALQLLQGKARFAPDKFNPNCVECGDTGFVLIKEPNFVERCKGCRPVKFEAPPSRERDLVDELLGNQDE